MKVKDKQKRAPSAIEKLLTPFAGDIMGQHRNSGLAHLDSMSSQASNSDDGDRDSSELRERNEAQKKKMTEKATAFIQ